MSLQKYSLTPEHRSQLEPWRDKWIANAMSTKPMDDDDRRICRESVRGLYAAAGLNPPPDHRIVFVPSPFVMRFAAGFAAAIWYLRNNATDAATRDATYAATYAATDAATYAATYAATRDATYAATYVATRDATRDATYAATRVATRDATRDATYADLSKWYVVPGDLHRLADELGVGYFGLRCAAQAYRMWQGGNQWSGFDSYLSFFQEVAGLDLPVYEHYRHWRTLAERSGPRIVHPDFCMISDRPERLMVDDQNRPHAENGPFCRWRDGTELYSWHGARLPARWIIERETIDPTEILRCDNVEQRAAGAACIGWPRMLSTLDYRVIDSDPDPSHGELIELKLEGLREPGRFLKAECPRNGLICEGVPRVSEIDGKPIDTVLAVQAWRMGLRADEFTYPTFRT